MKGVWGERDVVTSNRERSSKHTLEIVIIRRLRTARLFPLELHTDTNFLKLTMSTTSSDSEINYDSEDSEISFIAGYDIEIETEESMHELCTGISSPTSSDEDDVAPHADDPLADEEWTANYEKKRKADEELVGKLKDRFHGKVEVSNGTYDSNMTVFTLFTCRCFYALTLVLA